MTDESQTKAFQKLSHDFPYLTQRKNSADHLAVNLPFEKHAEFFDALKKEGEYDMLMDVTGIDWSEDASPRFTAVYHFFSTVRHDYLRVACDLPNDAEPEVPTVCDRWPAADWHERETWDLMGIKFTGHPDMRRILMWESYPYHPLRKEFPLAGIETELPAADVADVVEAKVEAAPMMGGPFHASQDGFMSKSEPRAADQSWTETNPKPDKPKSDKD